MKKRLTTRPHPVLFPLPAALLTTVLRKRVNIDSCSWLMPAGLSPSMIIVALRSDYACCSDIMASGEFGVNMLDEKMVGVFDKCLRMASEKSEEAIRAKVRALSVSFFSGNQIAPPLIEEGIVNLECGLARVLPVEGSHVLFLARVMCVHFSKALVTDDNAVHMGDAVSLAKSHPLAFVMGEYWNLGSSIGKRSLNKIDRTNMDWNPVI